MITEEFMETGIVLDGSNLQTFLNFAMGFGELAVGVSGTSGKFTILPLLCNWIFSVSGQLLSLICSLTLSLLLCRQLCVPAECRIAGVANGVRTVVSKL